MKTVQPYFTMAQLVPIRAAARKNIPDPVDAYSNFNICWRRSVQFEFWSRSTADQISLSNKLFINFWCVSKMSTFVWSTSKNTFDRVTREKPWWVLQVQGWHPPGTGRQVIVFLLRNLRTFGGVKSQPFALDVGHLLICMLSLLRFIVYSIRTG